MAIKSAVVTYTVLPNTSYVIMYKKATDNTWIIPPNNPTNVSPFTIAGLETGILYDLKIQNNCGIITTQFTLTGDVTTIWVEGTFVCEQDTAFNQDETQYTGFSSPLGLMWDNTSSRFYVVDADDVLGNFWWFDPNTITGFGSANHISGSTTDINTFVFDSINRRVIGAGDGSGGANVLDISTNTITSLPYGTNASPGTGRRQPLGLSNDKLYAFCKVPDIVRTYNRSDLSFIQEINKTSIPSNTIYFPSAQGFGILFVGSEVWSYASSRTTGTIGRYSADLLNLNGTITLPGIANAFNGTFWQQTYYDQINNKVYIGDDGSHKLFVIDATTGSIVNTIQLVDMKGKLYCDFNIVKSDLDNNIYMQVRGLNSLNDGSPDFRLYKIDPISSNIIFLYPNTAGSSITLQAGTSNQWAVDPGTLSWTNPSGDWNTDGIVLKFSQTGTDKNTGKENVLTLDEMIPPYPPPDPTGNTKPNVVGDPDYIAPYTNLTNCPVTPDTTCPLFSATGGNDIIEYEVSVLNSVVANTSIASMRIQVLDSTGPTVQLEVTYTFPMSPEPTYKSATFTSVPSGSHQIDIQYLDSSNGVIASCTNVATVTTT